MFGISYENWFQTCDAYQNMNKRRLEAYLQLYPLSRINDVDWDKLKSKEYFYEYIDKGTFVNNPFVMFHTSHYMQKVDGSFRDAELISPILFLVLQSLGKEISNLYSNKRPENVTAYYAGNFSNNRYFYKSEYDNFFKLLNESIDSYQYYIKTDITSFFSNINVNRLMQKLDDNINAKNARISPITLNVIKEFLLYCGGGSYPLIESSVASSYLATIVYLEWIDIALVDYIETMIPCIERVKLVRYVDDLYILIQCPSPHNYSVIHEASIEIRNKYSSLLKEEGLALNTKKYAFKKTSKISEDLKKSLYDDHFNDTATDIPEYFPNALKAFCSKVLTRLDGDCIDLEQYSLIVQESFSRNDIKYTPEEVFNYLVYSKEEVEESEFIASTIASIVRKDVSVISLDSKRLLPLLIKLQSDRAIKNVLNRLFERHRQCEWNSNDTTVSIAYLLHSGFKHIDLLAVLKLEAPELYEYYSNYCRGITVLYVNRKCYLRRMVIEEDWVANYLYFMYIVRSDSSNHFEAFAFYKSFFDRFTGDLAYKTGKETKKTCYEKYYKEHQLKNFYSSEEARTAINRAHKLRMMNPITHASSEVITKPERMVELSNCAVALEEVIDSYLNENNQFITESNKA